MAVRYSGDVEVHLTKTPRGYRAVARWIAHRRVVRAATFVVAGTKRRADPRRYDAIARLALEQVLVNHPNAPVDRTIFGWIRLRRVFHAPCPI